MGVKLEWWWREMFQQSFWADSLIIVDLLNLNYDQLTKLLKPLKKYILLQLAQYLKLQILKKLITHDFINKLAFKCLSFITFSFFQIICVFTIAQNWLNPP